MKIKFKLPTWEAGDQFMKEIASFLNKPIEERDSKQIIEFSDEKVSFFPDDRGFAYIVCKVTDRESIEKIQEIRNDLSNATQDTI
ncbi:MAG: hypothetical protein ACW99F_06860 [Candidatus Hodarchaeales archaeon]|jgi:hypothetical protein